MKLFLLYLFVALIAAANSLDCICSTGAKNCDKGKCTSTDGGYCISEVWNHTTTQDFPANFTGCVDKTDSDVCKEGDFVFTAGKKFSWSSVCCTKTNCNSNTTAVNTTSTRKVCPTCFVFGSEHCNGTKAKCAVFQDYCLTISGEFKNGKCERGSSGKPETFFGQGCATPSAKVLGNGTKMVFGDFTISITTSRIEKAKDGASRIPGSVVFTVFLPYLIGLLLDKFLY